MSQAVQRKPAATGTADTSKALSRNGKKRNPVDKLTHLLAAGLQQHDETYVWDKVCICVTSGPSCATCLGQAIHYALTLHGASSILHKHSGRSVMFLEALTELGAHLHLPRSRARAQVNRRQHEVQHGWALLLYRMSS